MELFKSKETPETDLLFYLEMGDLSGSEGKEQEALEFYIHGLQRAKELHDKARIQQSFHRKCR